MFLSSPYVFNDYCTSRISVLDFGLKGWAVMDNVIVLNGTVFIVANDASKFPPVYRMFSSGVEMSNDPATFAGREATSRDIRIVSQREAAELFGPQGSRIEGVSFLCNDDKQCEPTIDPLRWVTNLNGRPQSYRTTTTILPRSFSDCGEPTPLWI